MHLDEYMLKNTFASVFNDSFQSCFLKLLLNKLVIKSINSDLIKMD